ncbi:MAG: DUF4349 domain-containing protein [Defluviitaleaceae bacterium]|nr:DUF4349 domain-containing protein [Defluviitaleaceae bacterium]
MDNPDTEKKAEVAAQNVSCEEAYLLFSVCFDGEADADEHKNLQAHFDSCEKCRAEFEKYCAFFSDLHNLPEEPLPQDFHENVMRRINEKPSAVFWRRIRPICYSAAGACACFFIVCALAVGISFLTQRNSASNNASQTLPHNSLLSDRAEHLHGEAENEAHESAHNNPINSAVAFGLPAGRTGADYIRLSFRIEILVDNLQEALDFINGLNGYSMTSFSSFEANYWSVPYGTQERRVEAEQYEGVKNGLRLLGEVLSETESAGRLTPRVNDLQSMLSAKETEINRLSDLLAKSLTIDVLTAVESRLGQVSAERDYMRGELNGLYSDAAMPFIYITVKENPPPPKVFPSATFATRIRESFISSANGTAWFFENALVFLAAAVLPLFVFAAISTAVVFIIYRLDKKKALNKKRM